MADIAGLFHRIFVCRIVNRHHLIYCYNCPNFSSSSANKRIEMRQFLVIAK
jgi:hypothetical protein